MLKYKYVPYIGRAINRIILTALSILVYTANVCGAELSDSARIQFKVSRTELDMNLGDNRAALTRMLDWLNEYSDRDSTYVIREVAVTGSASPEGSAQFNMSLSEGRARSIFDYFSNRVNLPDSLTSYTYTGSDWHGLYDMVMADAEMPGREEILAILTPIATGNDISVSDGENMLRQMKSLRGGSSYEYMCKHMFTHLRMSRVRVSYDKVWNTLHIPPLKDSGSSLSLDPGLGVLPAIGEIYGPVIECRPFYMDVKTNMLYDALAVPDIGVEFYLGKNWSIEGEWMYGWWSRNRSHRYWRIYGGDLTLRYWFGKAAHRKPLTGHHVGIYGGLVTYDFEFGGTGHMGGLPGHSLWDRCMHVAGVEYGYSLPVARRLNIDFTIGIGYMGGKEDIYHPEGDKYIWDKTVNRHWVGPTKAEISLVWLIGCSNHN
ncbi:MAG: DUF3575 domain-containing protein [Muribaculaceae bacterium]|nr:DUF3575 domain-containing protein [Muribaculaceae bacterium]